ncbi:plus-3-domain-containing protein [Lindgomyces ingoldianus]|uniref:Plus-3-domain-containing protein n=1 Tax=Lindgomyces ingoldianus TaxID=673940 RepID=A0ACB6QF50_9PLEO|nr:plus-3-domain-containing protein [Lindgomyces ingoldianus]KAF2465556.1 plus-3-domain-containing protein [Lindgomyces ingoldianus]
MSDLDDELFALAGGDEEAEEGEASSVAASSPNSLGSGAMDESDSERDEPDVRDSAAPYPVDGKYINEADRRRIDNLPQLERERILGERAEEAARAKFTLELARRAEQMRVDNAQNEKRQKRKASSVEPEDSHRKSSRQKVKTSDKLEAYKREREQRGQQQRQRMDDRRNGHRRRSSSGDRSGSDLDADGESEVEWDERARQAAAREEQPAQMHHFESVRVGRGFFAKVCFYPGFDEAMTGSFVRIGTGQDSMRRTLYKMAQIKGFSTGKPYVFEGKNGQRIATDQYVVAQHGSVKKEYTFLFLSNQAFTDADLDTYKQSLVESNSKVPTQAFLKRKYEDIKNLENRTWTDADIGEKIAKQNKYTHLLSTASTSVATPKADHTAQRLAEINRQNRKANSEQIRKALIEERHAELRARKAREKAFQKQKQEEQEKSKLLQVPGSNIDDLFEGSDRSRSATPAVVRAGTPAKSTQEKKGGIPTFRKRKMDDDIISSMDLGIDIEI